MLPAERGSLLRDDQQQNTTQVSNSSTSNVRNDLIEKYTIANKGKTLIEENLAENAKIRGEQLMSHFKNIQNDFPNKIKEVRGKGLLTAFEMYDSKHLDGHTVSVELLNNGIYAKETHHSTVRIAPALTIKPEHIDQIADGVRKVIKNL